MKDYIPSNQYPDYLMHYGVKGMTWKDHVKKDVEVAEFQTNVKDYGVPYISDHYPIILTFSIKKK